MVYDPTWDMPQPNWQQQGSFESGEVPPSVDPTAGTQICIGPLAQEWLPVILGALDQLRNPSTWLVADDDAMYTTLNRVNTLREIIAVSTGCEVPVMTRLQDCVLQTSSDGGTTWVAVPGWSDNFANCVRDAIPPPVTNPGDKPGTQNACNVSAFLASSIIQGSISVVTNGITLTRTLAQIGQDVANYLEGFGFTWSAGFYTAVHEIYVAISGGTLSDFSNAQTDPVLKSLLTCAIFGAISQDGEVTDGNFSTLLANIGGLTYTYPDVITAVHDYVAALGAVGLRGVQIGGALVDEDCSACTTGWCWQWDFAASDGGWTHFGTPCGTYSGGFGWETDAGCLGGNPYMAIQSPIFAQPALINTDSIFIDSGAWSGACSGGIRTIYFFLAGVMAGFNDYGCGVITPRTKLTFTGAAVLCDRIIIQWGTDSATSARLSKVSVGGVGVSPFGPNNCTE